MGKYLDWDDDWRRDDLRDVKYIPPRPVSTMNWLNVPGTGVDILYHDSQGIVGSRHHVPGTPERGSSSNY